MEHRPHLVRPPDDDLVQPRLWRSRDDKVVAGVIGGLSERLDVSATGLRWFVAIGTFFTGIMPGIVIYALLWSVTNPHGRPPRRFW